MEDTDMRQAIKDYQEMVQLAQSQGKQLPPLHLFLQQSGVYVPFPPRQGQTDIAEYWLILDGWHRESPGSDVWIP
jgi:hypothetical protein